jgi:PIN domain nuclease of toxin-antitoxin system
MNGYLLDTHTAIWFFNGNDRLSEKASKIIRDLSNPVYLSIASAWEVAIKFGLGKLDIDGRTADFINDAQTNDITFLPIKTAHLAAYESLPMIHRDPAYLRYDDRLLVATALAEQLTIITADEDIVKYQVPHIW